MGVLRVYASPIQEAEVPPAAVTPSVKAVRPMVHPSLQEIQQRLALGGTGDASWRTRALHQAQHHYGNRAMQRLVANLPVIQRKCACGGACGSCKQEEEDKLRRAVLQRQAVDASSPVSDVVGDVARHTGSGQP